MSATENKPVAATTARASSRKLEQAAVSDASITDVHVQLLREKPEPTEGFSPIPIFILFVFSALIFVAGIYMGTKSGKFSPLAFDVTRDYNAAVTATGPAEFDVVRVGTRAYTNQCAACHQPNGQGVPQAFPPLAGSSYVTGDEERLIKIVTHGLTGPVEVLGNTFNGVMPAQAPLQELRNDPKRVAAVLTYIRSSFGNAAPAVTPEKVQEVWTAVGNRTKPWTAEELGGN